jgi:hypothetical protein
MARRLLFVFMFIVICPCALEVIAPIIPNMIVTLRIFIIVFPHRSHYKWSSRFLPRRLATKGPGDGHRICRPSDLSANGIAPGRARNRRQRIHA